MPVGLSYCGARPSPNGSLTLSDYLLAARDRNGDRDRDQNRDQDGDHDGCQSCRFKAHCPCKSHDVAKFFLKFKVQFSLALCIAFGAFFSWNPNWFTDFFSLGKFANRNSQIRPPSGSVLRL